MTAVVTVDGDKPWAHAITSSGDVDTSQLTRNEAAALHEFKAAYLTGRADSLADSEALTEGAAAERRDMVVADLRALAAAETDLADRARAGGYPGPLRAGNPGETP